MHVIDTITATMNEWLQLALQMAAGDPFMLACILALATFATEDGALITGSLLVGSGNMDASLVITAVTTGIVVGDIGLYALGWSARENNFISRYLPLRRAVKLKHWLKGREAAVLFFSRFTPGTRFITYVTFGFLRLSIFQFALVLTIAASIWVTALVLFISEIQAIVSQIGSWQAVALSVVLAITVIFLLPRLIKKTGLAPTLPETDHIPVYTKDNVAMNKTPQVAEPEIQSSHNAR